ncbi:hypothetical protein HispidOSU_026627 [Sigmodon hispidus]
MNLTFVQEYPSSLSLLKQKRLCCGSQVVNNRIAVKRRLSHDNDGAPAYTSNTDCDPEASAVPTMVLAGWLGRTHGKEPSWRLVTGLPLKHLSGKPVASEHWDFLAS